MSNTRALIVLTAVALVGLVLYGAGQSSTEATATTEPAAAAVRTNRVATIDMPPDHEASRRDRIQREEAARQITRMRQLQEERQRRDEATRQTRKVWEEMRMRNEWKVANLVRSNFVKFAAMKRAAAAHPMREVDCEICDGDALLDICVICDGERTCPICQGSGRQRFDPELPCPACEGRKKCFFCAGRKRMKCVFCEDGKITSIARPPSTILELP